MRRSAPGPLFALMRVLACGSPPDVTGSGDTTSPWPHPRQEGDKFVLPVAFLDGTTVELVYDPALELERRTIQPSGELYAGIPDYKLGNLERAFLVNRSDQPITAEPAETYPGGTSGEIKRWAAVRESPEVLRFGPWLVELNPYLDRPLTNKQLAAHRAPRRVRDGVGMAGVEGNWTVRTWDLGEDPP